jgi:hypothetical protein
LYSKDYYIDVSEVTSTYGKTDSSWATHKAFKDQYQTTEDGESLFDCYLAEDCTSYSPTCFLTLPIKYTTANGTIENLKVALKGTRPHFNPSTVQKLEAIGGSSMQRTSQSFKIGGGEVSAFKNIDGDGVPLRYIVLVQAGGGGGGGTTGSNSACGGGGGGMIAAYFHAFTDKSYDVMVGSGGAGAGKNVSKGAGTDGSDSYIVLQSTIPNASGWKNPGLKFTQQVIAYGGKAGKDGPYGPGAGGSGTLSGTYNEICSVLVKTQVDGGGGGQGDKGSTTAKDGKKGTSVDETTMICAPSTDKNYSIKFSAQSGGTCDDGFGGGGGAAALGPGGHGGTAGTTSGAKGKTPASGFGGGGGGATYIFLNYITGGAGKQGTVRIYY